MAYREIQQKIQLKYGFESAILASNHNSLATIVSHALGGGSSSTPAANAAPAGVDVTKGATSVEQAVLAMNRMLSI